MITFLQEKLIFRSEDLPAEHKFSFSSPFKELLLTAEDGAQLHGLHFMRKNAKGILLYFHGNAGTVDKWGYWAEQLADLYVHDVVLMDYRGYGKSEGMRTMQLMLNDGLLFYKYCQQFYNEDQIVVFGRSLGGAFASHAMLMNNPKKLILESTFTSIHEVAKKRYWFLPLRLMLKYPFQNDQNIRHIKGETHIIHGSKDEVVDYEFGKRLFLLSQSTKKKFFTIEGAEHNDLMNYQAYFKALSEAI